MNNPGDTCTPRINVEDFVTCMQKPTIDSELFFPAEQSTWVGSEYQLNANARTSVAKNSGVRFQDTTSSDESSRSREQVQWDMSHVVNSLRQIRSNAGMESIVLSTQFLRTKDQNKIDRIKFGLKTNSRFVDDQQAADESHRNIVRTINKSGFKVEHPVSFDSKGGMAGLAAWANELSLKRKWRPPWWWLLFLLLPLLLWLRGCESDSFIGIPVSTKSLLIIVDQSNSMEPHMQQVRAEAKRLLANWQGTFTARYVNIIAYDDDANSALGEIKKVDQGTISELTTFLDSLQLGGGTNLESAMTMAAREIASHDRPVTAIILTDGQDASISAMLQDIPAIRDSFKNVDVTVRTCTPRLFNGGDPTPIDLAETGLKDFAEQLGGSFGKEKN
jgi:hypothetical protein